MYAITALVGTVLGLAVIEPTLLDVQSVFLALCLIAGLGGYQVLRQAGIDEQKAAVPPVYTVTASGVEHING